MKDESVTQAGPASSINQIVFLTYSLASRKFTIETLSEMVNESPVFLLVLFPRSLSRWKYVEKLETILSKLYHWVN